jgi:GT2 family glycosyltransferase
MVDVSVVICTRNRARALHASLESVAAAARACTGAEAELVIVDNASSDDTQAVVNSWAETTPLKVTLVREARKGLAVARNTGVRAAHGAVLAFTDDDCRLAPDYLCTLLELFARDPGMVVRGGRVDLGDPRDLPFTIKTDPLPTAYDGERHPGGFVHGCNMAMTRAAFDRIGLFDERFGAGAPCEAGEDTDYLYRAHLAGIAVEYAPSLVVAHHHGRRNHAEIAKLNAIYARGNGALYLKHARHWRLLRNFVWDVKGSVRELVGGAPIDPAFGFTYRANVLGCLRGMGRFAALALRDALGRGGR